MSAGRPTSAHEHVFLLTKSPTYFFDQEAVAEVATNGERFHGAYRHGGAGERTVAANGRTRAGNTVATRNLRNVWTIATESFPDAHFAVMAPDLAERCIKAGTSEKGCCPECGAPWARVVERTPTVPGRAAWAGLSEQQSKGGPSRVGGFGGGRAETTGWRATCACDAGPPVPATVLDPFAGACTTLLVADRLRRRSIGIELSPSYAEMARRRLERDAPLIAAAEAGTGEHEHAQPALPLGDVA